MPEGNFVSLRTPPDFTSFHGKSRGLFLPGLLPKADVRAWMMIKSFIPSIKVTPCKENPAKKQDVRVQIHGNKLNIYAE